MTVDYPQSFPTTGPLSISVRLGAGDVVVTAADVTEAVVDLQPARPGDQDALDVIARARVLYNRDSSLRVAIPHGRGIIRGEPPIEVRVTVPTGSSAEAGAGSADVSLEGRFGAVTIETGSGDITVDACGDARVRSGSGDVRIDEVRAASVKSGSGDIVVRRASSDIDLQAASGDIRVDDVGANARFSSSSGDIEVGAARGRIGAKTASGDILVARASEGQLELNAASGNVSVGVVDGTAVKLDCSSVSGRVESQLEPTDAPDDTDRRLLVTARTASGGITISRAS
jgi:hypothetical protein